MRKLIGVLAVAAFFIAACGGDSKDNPAAFGDQDTAVTVDECVNPPVTVPNITVLGQQVKGVSDLSVCVQASVAAGIVPEIQNADDCGNPCYAVVINDFDIASDSKIEINYKEDGKPVPPIVYDPQPQNQSVGNGRLCVVGVASPGSGDPCAERLTPPRNLTAAPAKTKASLQWRASTDTGDDDILGYEIWWSEDGQNFVYVANAPQTTYTDTGLSRRTTYWYFVVAIDATGHRSLASNTAQVMTK